MLAGRTMQHVGYMLAGRCTMQALASCSAFPDLRTLAADEDEVSGAAAVLPGAFVCSPTTTYLRLLLAGALLGGLKTRDRTGSEMRSYFRMSRLPFL